MIMALFVAPGCVHSLHMSSLTFKHDVELAFQAHES